MPGKFFIAGIFALFLSGLLHAQQAWWVFFTDKNGSTFDPYSYFAPEAIARRQALGISLYDSTDFPVSEKYISGIRPLVDTVGYATRWFNGVGVVATEDEIAVVRQLPFVREVIPQLQVNWQPASAKKMLPDTTEDDVVDDRRISQQIDPLGGKRFAEKNYRGKGIVVAVLDVGFAGVNSSPAFEKLRFDNRIRATFDFVHNTNDVYSKNLDHGTEVLSCIVGEYHGQPLGLAPDATVLLARIAGMGTSQSRGEEHFVAAIEWCDKNGAMLINCSDGPDGQTYFPEQMDGRIPLVSRASNMAARKGMLVISAAGNEGMNGKPAILPPADADSVLSVTALNDKGYIADFSSFGPPPDFRRKPDVCAPGTVVVANGYNDFAVDEGTSFSAPLLVGFAACLEEMYPNLSPMSLIDSLQHAGSLYPYYDYAHGYGAPQASHFFDTLQPRPQTFSFSKEKNNDETILIDENFLPGHCLTGPAYLYYSLEDEHGRIYKYEVLELNEEDRVIISNAHLRRGVKLHVFYQGYYATEEI